MDRSSTTIPMHGKKKLEKWGSQGLFGFKADPGTEKLRTSGLDGGCCDER